MRNNNYMTSYVYAVEYTSCIYESSFETLSLYKDKSTAVKAMCALKHEKYKTCVIGMDAFEDADYFVSKRITLDDDEPMFHFRFRIIPIN